MAFGGTFLAPNVMLPIGLMTCPQGILTYNADGISLDLQRNGAASSFAIPRIDNLRITGTVDQSDPVFDPFVAVGDGTSGDRGTLVSADPNDLSNENHGIPVNFGPGRDNWTQADVERLRPTILFYQSGSLADVSIGQAVVQSVVLASGDISILFRNISLADCNTITLELEYRHTIELI
jgi:hypothetical protein